MFYQTQPNNDDILLIKAAGVTDSFLDHPLPWQSTSSGTVGDHPAGGLGTFHDFDAQMR